MDGRSGGWRAIGEIAVETAVAGFGDAVCIEHFPAEYRRVEPHVGASATVDLRPAGIPFLGVDTGEACDAIVEVSEGSGVHSARISFVDAPDDVDGRWVDVGEIEITSGRCVAADPYSDGDRAAVPFDAPRGVFPVQALEVTRPAGPPDRIALRIVFER